MRFLPFVIFVFRRFLVVLPPRFMRFADVVLVFALLRALSDCSVDTVCHRGTEHIDIGSAPQSLSAANTLSPRHIEVASVQQ